MNVTKIAIPIKKGRYKCHLEKGRAWSVFEHAVLAALAIKDQSITELTEQSNLPRRVILECVSRLMSAGWVELSQKAGNLIFSATPRGKSIADQDELPAITKRVTKRISFLVDEVTGTVYRSRDFNYIERHLVNKEPSTEKYLVVPSRTMADLRPSPGDLVGTLLDDDEIFISMEPSSDRLQDKYAIVSLRDGEVEGMPERAPLSLRQVVYKEVQRASLNTSADPTQDTKIAEQPFETTSLAPLVDCPFQLSDLIIDGAQHRSLFESILKKAAQYIVIHSTFISEDRLFEYFPLLVQARSKGVRVYILWGEDDEKTDPGSTYLAIEKASAKLAELGVDHGIRIEKFSTQSHSKIIVADDGEGNHFAVVGSCNWLSSNFVSFEASVRLRGQVIVKRILLTVAQLSTGRDGYWTKTTDELARIAASIKPEKSEYGSKAKVGIVCGAEHGAYVRKARDEATNGIYVTSHRFGAANKPAVIIPAIAAVAERKLNIEVFYGRISDTLTNTDAAALQAESQERGVHVRPIVEPRLHAKLLGWDRDHLVVSSQNWLSADPGVTTPLKEIGVYINFSNVARRVLEQFKLAIGR